MSFESWMFVTVPDLYQNLAIVIFLVEMRPSVPLAWFCSISISRYRENQGSEILHQFSKAIDNHETHPSFVQAASAPCAEYKANK